MSQRPSTAAFAPYAGLILLAGIIWSMSSHLEVTPLQFCLSTLDRALNPIETYSMFGEYARTQKRDALEKQRTRDGRIGCIPSQVTNVMTASEARELAAAVTTYMAAPPAEDAEPLMPGAGTVLGDDFFQHHPTIDTMVQTMLTERIYPALEDQCEAVRTDMMLHPLLAPRVFVVDTSITSAAALDMADFSSSSPSISYPPTARFAAMVSLSPGTRAGGPVWSSDMIRANPGFCCADTPHSSAEVACGVFKNLTCDHDEFEWSCNCDSGTVCDADHIVRHGEGQPAFEGGGLKFIVAAAGENEGGGSTPEVSMKYYMSAGDAVVHGTAAHRTSMPVASGTQMVLVFALEEDPLGVKGDVPRLLGVFPYIAGGIFFLFVAAVVAGNCLPTISGKKEVKKTVTPAAAALMEKMKKEEELEAKKANKAAARAHLTAKKGGSSAKKNQ